MKELMKGNEAMAEAAVRAGLELYVGYPITPQSEIVEYLSGRMPEIERHFIQSESEIESINTVIGGALTGAKVMTSSCGVGLSLMQEGLSDAFAKGLPCMIIDVGRTGAGMGGAPTNFGGSQDCYLRDTRGGGNGEYRYLVYCPNSIQEAIDLIYEKWDVAEKYRNPIMIMTEGRLGQMMESVEFPEFKEIKRQSWGMDGTTKPILEYGPMRDHNDVFVAKMKEMEEHEQEWEEYEVEDAETIFVTVGTCSRMVKKAVKKLRADGHKVGIIRPISVWPFPMKAFEKLGSQVKNIVCVETAGKGQMVQDVVIAMKREKKLNTVPLYNFHKLPYITDKEVISYYLSVEDGTAKEV